MKKTMILFAVMIAFGLIGNTFAQSISGAIQGTAKDQTGAVLPSVSITLIDESRNTRISTYTNNEGFYFVPNLSPGHKFTVTAKLEGFQTETKIDVVVSLNKTTVVDFTLFIGPLTDEVRITAETTKIETTKGEVSFEADSFDLENLPLGRDVYSSVFLFPGIASAGTNDFSNGAGFSSSGQRGRSNNFTIDGADNNDPTVTGPIFSLRSPETVQEVQVITNSYKPEYGRNMGSVVNVITRGGTNELHADANYFYVGSGLSSLNNLEKNAGFEKKPWFVQHQYGLVVDGPVVKNKLFFLGYFEKEEFRGIATSPTFVAPTQRGHRTLLGLLQQGLVNKNTTALLVERVPPSKR